MKLFKNKLIRGLVILFILVFAGMSAANATVFFSINAGADGGNVTALGGTVYELGGATPLDGTDAGGNAGTTGSLVQYIRVGTDGVKSSADPTKPNYIGGDDVLVATKYVGNDTAWQTFSNQDGLFYHGVAGSFAGTDTNAAKIYIRIWNKDTISGSSYYIDSSLLTPNTSVTVQPQPNDVGTGNLTCNQAKPVDEPPNPTLTIKDQTTGSETYSNSTAINVTIANDATATAWLLSETADTKDKAIASNQWVAQEPTTYTLSSNVNGSKTVYVWVKNGSGNVNPGPAVSKSITLDTTAPADPTNFKVTDQTSGSESYTNSTTVNVSVDNNPESVQWLVVEGTNKPAENAAGWSANKPTSFTLSNTQGSQTASIWVKDAAGNVNAGTVSKSITLDTTAPADPTNFKVTDQTSGSESYTNATAVNVSIDNHPESVQWLVVEGTNKPAENTAGWSVNKPTSFTLSNTQGSKTVSIWVKDAAGNVNAGTVSKSITLDTGAPTVSSSNPTTPAAIGANIEIIFSEAMKPSSVNVTSSPNPAGGLTLVGWTNGDKTVTYSHTAAFNYSTEYTINISGQDLAENAINTSFKFTTVAPGAPSISTIWNNANTVDITNVGEKVMTNIRIKGSNFGAVEKVGSDYVWPKVTFNNNKPGTIWYAAPDNDAIEIQVQIPQGATTGNITVQSKAGTSGTKSFTILPPAQITDLTAKAGDQKVDLSWTKPSDDGFTETLIVRKANSAPTFAPENGIAYTQGKNVGDSTVVYNDKGTSTIDSNLTNGTTYYYAAFAHDGGPNYKTPAAEKNATPQGIPNTITVTSPKQGDVWNTGDKPTITWSSTGSIANVKIEIFYELDGKWYPVDVTTNNGSYIFPAPISVNADVNSKIRVSDAANASTYGDSGVFTIKAAPKPPAPTLSKVYNKKEGASAKWVYVTEYDPNWTGTPEESLNLIVEGASLGENSTDYKKSDNNNAPAGSKIEVKAYNSDKFVEIKDTDTPDRMYWWQKDKIEIGIHDKLGGSNVVAGAAKVKVTTPGGSAEESFAVKPRLYGLTSSAKAGETVKITGTAFGTSVDSIKVKFGSVETKPAKAENTTLEVTVPADAATGNVTVVVNGEESNSMAFSLTDSPTLSVDPAGLIFTAVEGGANPSSQSLTIKNTGKGTLKWNLAKGSTWLSVSPTSGATTAGNSDTITVSVNSAGLTAGEKNDSITVTSNGGDTAVQVTLKINSPSLDTPSVTKVSPSAAPAGIRITVEGDKFGSSEGQSRLVFENTATNTTYAAEIKSWSNTSIDAIVPRLAVAGDYKLKVIRMSIAAGTGTVTALESNPSDFLVTASGAADVVTMYPNPVNAGKESVTIAYNAGGATNIGIYLFDMTARLVYKTTTSAGQITWNGIDQDGFTVGDGVYIIRVINEDTKGLIARGKLLVVKK